VVAAAIVSALAAFVGVFGSVRRAVRLPPAEAMRPEPPARFRPALLERAGLAKRISVSARMALRNLERKPTQALLTSVALSLATAILIIPNSFRDGINHILDFQWDIVQRDTVMISLVEPGPARVLHDFEHLPGVIHAEAFRGVPVELRSGNRSRRLSIYGQPAAGHLSRVLGAEQKQIPLPAYGLVLSEKLAEVLDVSLGDRIHVRVLDGSRPEAWIPITGLAQDFAGVAVYMEIDALNRLLGQGDQINGAHLMVAAGAWPAFLAAIKETPRAAGTIIKNSMRDSFRDTTAQSIGLIQTIYLFFATVVAFGIVYNSARISLSERQRELATLRVLGFTRAEVGAVLVGELVVLALVALPAGLVLGSLLAKAILTSVNTETVRLPLVLTASNYAFATLVVAVATTLSLLLACRRLNQLDLVGALKAAD
jgi:putative ABC transport system permease protein